MADALCGPSNAIQNFQKHSQVDRTLQQDRLVSRHSSSQGFRSSPGPNAGLLDPEFEAFQAGHVASPPPLQFDNRPFAAHNLSHFAPQQPQLALPDWANDFQRLHIDPASHLQTSAPAVQRAPVTTHSPQTSSWHQDFMQAQQPMTSFHQPQAMFQPFQDMSWEYQQPAQFAPVSQGKQKLMQEQDSQWNAEAFARAFEAASLDAVEAEPEYDDGLSQEMLEREIAREIEMETEEIQFLIQARAEEQAATQRLRQETNHLQGLDLSQGMLDVDEEFAIAEGVVSAEQFAQPDDGQYMDDPHPFLRDDMMHEPGHDMSYEEQQQETTASTPKSIDEELARTAGHLLESVSHDTSEKFQSSVFLQLMRRLRDKEVTVEGENFVEVSEDDPLQSISTPPSAEQQQQEVTGEVGLAGSTLSAAHTTSTLPIPEDEQDSDLGRFGIEGGEEAAGDAEPDATVPARPLTPEFDPPAPPFEDWRNRLWGSTVAT